MKAIAFSDDNFFTNLDRASQILEGLIQKRFNIVWGKGDIRLDVLSRLGDDFLHLIEKSGCLSLMIGIESGSQRIADLIRKDIDLSQAVSINQRLTRYQMQLQYFFLIGIPGETEVDLAQTASLMVKLMDDNPKAREGVNIFTPYPGTELFELAKQYGLPLPQKLEEWIPFSWANRRLDYPWLSPQRRRLLQMLSFCGVMLATGRKPRNFSNVSPFISLVAKLYSPIAHKRIAELHYQFLPELKVAEWLGFRGY
jgi:anaerobic magnesium-protoporphyrin IX monomethyl ester cyclase